MRSFQINRNPYYQKKNLYPKKELVINPGLTVLCGCNGSGKSTLLKLLKEKLEADQSVSMLYFNNYTDGGSMAISSLIFHGYMERAAGMTMSSEGERINQTVAQFVREIGATIRSRHPKELWVLMDAIGSGLSIDGIDQIKDFIDFVRGEETETTFYFVVCTNEYEFALGSDCIDVTTFTHKSFPTYDSYKKYILKTREKKDKRDGVETT